jgi:AraC family transcriptional regulator
MAIEQSTELNFASARVVYAMMPPHEPDGYTSTSEPLAIGVSFTAHAKAVVADGAGRTSEWSFPAGTCSINGDSPTTWLRVSEPAEAVEIHASPDALAAVAEEAGFDWNDRPDFFPAGEDPVIWGVCARFRMAALGARPIEALEANSLVGGLLVHVAMRHLGVRPRRRPRGRLDRRRLARVTAYLEGLLFAPPSMREMADVAAMSPFHFQRAFRATTGLSPHAYVAARRMEAARRMLDESDGTVGQIAARLGFSDVAHFRRSFRRHFNAAPRERRKLG